MTDFYDLLGVRREASDDDIKKAYRRRARELHPDANPDDPGAEEQFKELARAYEVLSDPQRRRRYDQFGAEGLGGAAGGGQGDVFGGGLGDLFDAFFGGHGPFGGANGRSGQAGPPRGQDLEVVADLRFEQAVFGATVPVAVRTAVVCDTCAGSGAGGGTQPVTCSECNGAGQVRRVRQSVLGQMVTSGPCQKCGGTGRVIVSPCGDCRGDGRVITEREYQVDVPPGVDTGATLRLTGRGAVGPRGGAAGDLYVHVRVAPHDRYTRDGFDLVTKLDISIAQAALGTHLTLATLDGDEELIVPPGTQPGRQFVLRNRGVPHLQGRGRGDLRVVADVRTPTKLTRVGSGAAAPLRRGAGRDGQPARQGPPVEDQVRLLVSPDPLLVAADAHVFVDDLDAPALCDVDAHHLSRVLRLRRGDPVTISDGRGRWRPCRFVGGALLEPDGEVRREHPAHAPVTIAFALLKGDRNDLVVQKLTEIGAQRIVPMTTERIIVRWDETRAASHHERLVRIAREASMQSRRVFLPDVEPVKPFAAMAQGEGAALAAVGGPPLGPGTTTVLVGPEGGWSPTELGVPVRRVGLGPHILRAETGSIVACALLVAFLTGQVTPHP